MKSAAGRIVAGSLLGAMLLTVLSTQGAAAAGPTDRLDRFRELANGIDPLGGGSLAEIYALLDAEMVESLTSGGLFASPAFLQDRLEAFTEAWGGLAVRLIPLARTMVAAFSFTELPQGSTVRVYGRGSGQPALLTTFEDSGWPVLRSLPPSLSGARQLLVTWEGAPAADRARPVRFDVVREEPAGARVAWSSSALFPEGLIARWYVVRGAEITVRHDARYPGWAPGCDGQAEYEDTYRLPRGASAFARASRRDVNAWHRDVHALAERVFAALARGDRAALGALVPDVSLRTRLPSTLRSEPACDAPPGRDGAVSIAAVADLHDPWTLTFRRTGGRWRLTAAAPMAP